MSNLELDAVAIIDKLTRRIADDVKTMAMLEATLDVYKNQIEEMAKQIAILQGLQEQG